jgi:hypothetical protein
MKKTYIFMSLFYALLLLSFKHSAMAQCTTVNAGSISGPAVGFNCSGDGVADIVNFSMVNAVGPNTRILVLKGSIITDILPASATTYNLEGFESRTFSFRSAAYDNTAQGFNIGASIANLSGCYALGNTVVQATTFAKTAGTIAFSTGGTSKAYCVSDGLADVPSLIFTGNDSFGLEFVKLDLNGNIIWQGSNIPNFEGTAAGTERLSIITSCFETFNSFVGTNIGNLPANMDASNILTITKNINCSSTVCAPEVKACPGKVLMCVNGISTCVASNQVNKMLKQGAIRGGCIKCTTTGGRQAADLTEAETSENEPITIGPNPNNGNFTVTSEWKGNHQFELLSTTGNKVWESNMKEAFDGKYEISLKNDAIIGQYILKISNDKKAKYRKVLIVK